MKQTSLRSLQCFFHSYIHNGIQSCQLPGFSSSSRCLSSLPDYSKHLPRPFSSSLSSNATLSENLLALNRPCLLLGNNLINSANGQQHVGSYVKKLCTRPFHTSADSLSSKIGDGSDRTGDESTEDNKPDWFIRIFRVAIVLSLLSAFWFNTAGFYGPIASQLVLLKSEEPYLRQCGLARLTASCSETRVEEMQNAGAFHKLVSVIKNDKDALVRLEALKAVKAWAQFQHGWRYLVAADAIPALQRRIGDMENKDKDLYQEALSILLRLI